MLPCLLSRWASLPPPDCGREPCGAEPFLWRLRPRFCRFGAATQLFSTYLANDRCVAVSEFTRELIVDAAAEVDDRLGTRFAAQCLERVGVSYPAIDSSSYTSIPEADVAAATAARTGSPRGPSTQRPSLLRAGP